MRAIHRFGSAILIVCVALGARAAAADTIGFLSPQNVVREDEGTIVLTVYRSGTGVGAASVDVSTIDGSAHAGVNFTAVSTTVSWASGDRSIRQVTVPIIHDNAFDGYPTFTVHLGNVAGGVLGQASVLVSITDIDPNPDGVLRVLPALAVGTVQVGEGAGSAVFTVERVGGSLHAVTVPLTVIGSLGATQGVDFAAPSPATLSWNAGEVGPKSATIAIIDNAVPQPNRQFGVAMFSTTGGASLDLYTSGVTYEIVDDDPPINGTLSVPSATIVHEGDGQATIVVQRVGGASGAVSVHYQSNDSSALAGSDYTAVSGTLSWSAGDATPRTIAVPIADDLVAEDTENLYVSFDTPTGGLVLPDPLLNAATITILDDDVMSTLGFAGDGAWVAESAGAAVLTVVRVGDASGAVSVQYATSDGSAVAPTDYTATSGVLSWAAGDATPRSISVPIIDDSQPNASRSCYVTLSNPTGGALVDPDASVITIAIADDELPAAAGAIGFAAGVVVVGESAGTATFTVTRTGGSTGRVTASYSTSPVTAVSPDDFIATSGTLIWPDGDAAPKTISVPITDDAVAEGVESFLVDLAIPSGGAAYGTIGHARCVILDDDPAPAGRLSFAASSIAVVEGAGAATFRVVRSGGAVGAVSVTCATARDTTWSALEGVDFQARLARLSWNDGETGAKTLVVPIVDDAVDRGTRTFRALLSAPTGGAVIDAAAGPAQCVCTITDDDLDPAGTLGFSATTASIGESAGTVQLVVRRVGGTTGAVSVRYDAMDVTAIGGLDYTPVAGWLSWPAGDATTRTITVPITADALVEPDEHFWMVLSSPTGGAAIGGSTIDVTIVDDDPAPAGRIGFAAASAILVEGHSAALRVARVGGALGAVSVAYDLADDTTTAGVDWTGASGGTLTWADGDAADQFIAVAAVADGVAEGRERLVATLRPPTGGALLSRASMDVLIDDPAPPSSVVVGPPHAASSGHHHGACGIGGGLAAAACAASLLRRRNARR